MSKKASQWMLLIGVIMMGLGFILKAAKYSPTPAIDIWLLITALIMANGIILLMIHRKKELNNGTLVGGEPATVVIARLLMYLVLIIAAAVTLFMTHPLNLINLAALIAAIAMLHTKLRPQVQ
jgi:hypothetical protein